MEVKVETEQRHKYTLRITYLPDGNVECVTLWKENLTSEELGEVVKEIDKEHHPPKLIVVDR